MNSATNSDGSGRTAEETPGTDIQPEDAGTQASGNSGRGTASEGAMKQTSKTASETGTGRPAEDGGAKRNDDGMEGDRG